MAQTFAAAKAAQKSSEHYVLRTLAFAAAKAAQKPTTQ